MTNLTGIGIRLFDSQFRTVIHTPPTTTSQLWKCFDIFQLIYSKTLTATKMIDLVYNTLIAYFTQVEWSRMNFKKHHIFARIVGGHGKILIVSKILHLPNQSYRFYFLYRNKQIHLLHHKMIITGINFYDFATFYY